MGAPPNILELVERYARNRDAYRSESYNETQLRREFLDPLFKTLGWDIDNERGYAESFKDVVHEDAIKVGEATKAPDYCFRIGGTRKFFVEAKRPATDLRQDAAPAFQLRRYAFTESMPLSILSNFEEFAVFDGRLKPHKNDPAAKARVLYVTWREYGARWDELAAIFARESVLKGGFDKYAGSVRLKRGTAEVDQDFLNTIEGWRRELAQNIALRNPALGQKELNFAVQRVIDRIIFLRICEGRGLESYGRLQALVNGARIYPRLGQLFEQADDRYNSGLFHFRREKSRDEAPDELTPGLEIDDKLLRDILTELYYPECPYVFSHLPADFLGQVYEQFLGKVIRLTPGHRAVVEEKPEMKKAGGVYYTPAYIVRYIVGATVGALLEGKTPKQAAKLRVLDPACGSGSFLLGAYEHLLAWHRDWYAAHDPQSWAGGSRPTLYQHNGGEWRLTTLERKRILVNNIFGVDIDPQAVETTKLSLLLKVLEGESQASLERQLKIFHERALPDLGANLKCGNSLVGTEFYSGQQLMALDAEERYRINVFDWAGPDGFPPILQAGGFDAVIGNPPYVRQESLAAFKDFFQRRYTAYHGTADLFAYFMEQGLELLREGGLYSVIVSSSLLRAGYAEPLRRTLQSRAAVRSIVDFGGLPVFSGAKDTYVCIPLLAKGGAQEKVAITRLDSLDFRDLAEEVAARHFMVSPKRLTPAAWSLKSDREAAVFAKVLRAGQPLGDYVGRRLFYGVKTGLNAAFELNASARSGLIKGHAVTKRLIKPFLGGQDIRRYVVEADERFLIVIPCGWTRQQMARQDPAAAAAGERAAWKWFTTEYPALSAHLQSFSAPLRQRDDQGDFWWELRPCDYYDHFEAPKIIFPDICKGPRFALDRTGVYLANTAYCLGSADLYLLGFLNSRLFWFAISHLSIPFGVRAGEYRYRLIYQYMENVPVRVIDPARPDDVTRRDRVVALVEQTLELHRQLPLARTPQEQTVAERQIAAIDDQIESLLAELYGLTPADREIVACASTTETASGNNPISQPPPPPRAPRRRARGKITTEPDEMRDAPATNAADASFAEPAPASPGEPEPTFLL